MAEHGEQRGQDGERRDHVDRDRGDAAVAHGAEEDRLEQHQSAQRERNGDAGDEDRTARGGHGPRDGVLHVLGVAAQFLAEPGDDEQAVVDAQAEAHDRGDVHRVDGDRGGQREQPEHGEGAEDRQAADRERGEGRHHAAEDEHQEDEQHGERDRLGPGDVRADRAR